MKVMNQLWIHYWPAYTCRGPD